MRSRRFPLGSHLERPLGWRTTWALPGKETLLHGSPVEEMPGFGASSQQEFQGSVL